MKEGKSEYKKICNNLLEKSIQDFNNKNENNEESLFFLFINTLCRFSLQELKDPEKDIQEDLFRFELGCLLIAHLKMSKQKKEVSLYDVYINNLKKTFIQKSSYCLSRPVAEVEVVTDLRVSYYENEFKKPIISPDHLAVPTDGAILAIKNGGKLFKFDEFPTGVNLGMDRLFYIVSVQLWCTHILPPFMSGAKTLLDNEITKQIEDIKKNSGQVYLDNKRLVKVLNDILATSIEGDTQKLANLLAIRVNSLIIKVSKYAFEQIEKYAKSDHLLSQAYLRVIYENLCATCAMISDEYSIICQKQFQGRKAHDHIVDFNLFLDKLLYEFFKERFKIEIPKDNVQKYLMSDFDDIDKIFWEQNFILKEKFISAKIRRDFALIRWSEQKTYLKQYLERKKNNENDQSILDFDLGKMLNAKPGEFYDENDLLIECDSILVYKVFKYLATLNIPENKEFKSLIGPPEWRIFMFYNHHLPRFLKMFEADI